MNRSSRKKLKDTKVGGWLREKSPKILGIVGDLLPESGILGVIKNLVDSDHNISALSTAMKFGLDRDADTIFLVS
jgi:hypothetical protein